MVTIMIERKIASLIVVPGDFISSAIVAILLYPVNATIFACLVVLILELAGDIKSNWSLSAFKVLVYYSITNLAALRLKAEDRFFPRWVSYAGLSGCLLLVVFFEHKTLLQGTVLILAGIIWFYMFLLINRIRHSG